MIFPIAHLRSGVPWRSRPETCMTRPLTWPGPQPGLLAITHNFLRVALGTARAGRLDKSGSKRAVPRQHAEGRTECVAHKPSLSRLELWVSRRVKVR